jgi:RHS repeat-associated protein
MKKIGKLISFFSILLLSFCNQIKSQSFDQLSPVTSVDLNRLVQIGNNLKPCIDTTQIGPTTIGQLTQSALVIGFLQQPMLEMSGPHVEHFTKVALKVIYLKSQERGQPRKDSVRIFLSLNYDKERGTDYKVKDFYKIDSVLWAQITIDTFHTTGAFSEGSKQLLMSYQIIGKQYNDPYNIDNNKPSIKLTKTANNGYIHVEIDPAIWASSYDLEWRFVDLLSTEELSLDKRATRINTTKQEYDVPIITSKAKFIARVRGRIQRPNLRDQIGKWSDIGAPIIIEGNYVFEQDKKPWQYQATYAENGFRSDVVNFFDGTGKSRQTLTKSNSFGQHIIAMETFYDSLGRPAINVLPTPLKPDVVGDVVAMGSTPSKKYPRLSWIEMRNSLRSGFQKYPKRNSEPKLDSKTDVQTKSASITTTQSDGTPVITSSVSQRVAPPSLPARFLPDIPTNRLPGLNIPPINSLPSVTWNPKLPEELYSPLKQTPSIPDIYIGRPSSPSPINFSDLEGYTANIPALNYVPLLNTNVAGKQYSAADFDRLTINCEPGLKAAPMSATSGTGKYYSPSNDIEQVHQGEIPDAEGYPFTQVEYTPDNTGRVKRQGSAGKTMQIGGGNEITNYYSVPTSGELRRLFGNEVGDANNYLKVLTKNQDKQLIIKYLNSKGQTIAAGLTGSTPPALVGLPDKETNSSEMLSIAQAPSEYEIKNGYYEVDKTTVVETEGSDMRVHFSLTNQQLASTLCRQNICYDCPKSILIQVKDDCGKSILDKKILIGLVGYDPQIDHCTNFSGITFDTTLSRLKIGNYFVKKSIVLDAVSRAAYINNYVSRDTACYIPNLPPPVPCPPPPPCKPCKYLFIRNGGPQMLTDIPEPGKSSNILNKYKIARASYTPCSDVCIDNNPEWDIEKFFRMKNDIRPGGRYGCYKNYITDDTFSLYIHTSISSSPIYRTIAIGNYIDTDGKVSWIDCTGLEGKYLPPEDYIESERSKRYDTINGRLHTIPQQIVDIAYLSTIWQDTWSDLLVAYHPEYQKFYFDHVTAEQSTDRDFDTYTAKNVKFDRKMMHVTTTFDDALEMGIFRTDGNIELSVASDTFFAKSNLANIGGDRNVRSIFITKLKNLHQTGTGRYVDIYSLVIAQVFCNGPYYNQLASANDYNQCALENKASKLAVLTIEEKFYIWHAYKVYYQTVKQKLIDSLRQASIMSIMSIMSEGSTSYQLALCAGIKSSPNCNNCDNVDFKRRLGKMDPVYLHLRCVDNTAADVTAPYRNTITTLDTIAKLAELKMGKDCKKTLNANSLLSFFNTLAQNEKGTLFDKRKVNLNYIPPIVIPNNLIGSFPNQHAKNYYWTAKPENNKMEVAITDENGANQTILNFTKRNTVSSWSDISFFGCIDKTIEVRPSDKNSYRLIVFLTNGQKDTIYLKLDEYLDPVLKHNPARIAELESILITNGRFTLDDGPSLCCMNFVTPTRVIESSCDQANQEIYAAAIQAAKVERANFIRDSIGLAYNRRCIVGEQFTVAIDINSYYFTLFYYDQAGNLIQTMPPKGVNANGTGVHDLTLATKYTYNTNGKLLTTSSPDGGLTKMIYDQVDRPILSQDAVQRSTEKPTASYIMYDEYGRTKESGAVTLGSFNPGTSSNRIELNNIATFNIDVATMSGSSAWDNGYLNHNLFKALMQTTSAKWEKLDRTIFNYDSSVIDMQPLTRFKNKKQEYLRNRISNIKSYYDNGKLLEHAMYFTYDVTGNTKEIIQDIAALVQSTSNNIADLHRYKSIRYLYDQLSGKVNQISYQEDQPDQFYRWYTYDADMRVVAVKTGFSKWEPEGYKDIDARYEYYKHGPISRMTLGSENVQSIDMAYNINGMLKNVNNGIIENHGSALPDALGYTLHYYDGDYKRINTSNPYTVANPTSMGSLYSGNISAVSMLNMGLGDQTPKTHKYKYDQLNRLISSRSTSDSPEFQMDLGYDKNGNITILKRANKEGILFDDLTYQYSSIKKNQLSSISDRISNRGLINDDLETQPANNYTYDQKGRLITDQSEENMKLLWSPTDKLRQVSKNGSENQFYYDVYGRRSMKKAITNGISTTELTVRDLAGNVLSEYKIKGDSVILKSIPIYAGSRIGSIEPSKLIKATDSTFRWSQYRGHKLYELKNQIGDINALVSDRRLVEGETTVTADIRKATEYYPFGMIMPGRDSSSIAYRYGFQGMEQDDNIKGGGNSISTEFRQYDPRVGRWLSVEPLAYMFPNLSPFENNHNNPIIYGDQKGDFAHILIGAGVGAGISIMGDLLSGNEVDWAAAGKGALMGGISAATCGIGTAAIGATTFGGAMLSGAALNGGISFTMNVVDQAVLQGKSLNQMDWTEAAINGGVSALTGAIGGAVGKGLEKSGMINNFMKHGFVKTVASDLMEQVPGALIDGVGSIIATAAVNANNYLDDFLASLPEETPTLATIVDPPVRRTHSRRDIRQEDPETPKFLIERGEWLGVTTDPKWNSLMGESDRITEPSENGNMIDPKLRLLYVRDGSRYDVYRLVVTPVEEKK